MVILNREREREKMISANGNWHKETMAKMKKAPADSLIFIIRDCKEAIKANPDNPKNGRYADEISYAAMEISARRKAAR